MFKTNEIEFDRKYRKELVRDSLSLTAILIFITSFYTLPLVWELIILPIATLLSMLQVYAQHYPQYKDVEKPVTIALSIIGFSYLAYGIHGIYKNPEFLFTISNGIEFVLPLFLTMWYLPYLFAWKFLLVHERLQTSVRRNIKDPELRRFLMCSAIWHLKWDTKAIERLRSRLFMRTVLNRYDIMKQIQWTKLVSYRDKYMIEDSDHWGWAPRNAKTLLAHHDLLIKEYTNPIEDEWFGIKSSKITDFIPWTTLEYEISGDEGYVKELKLTMEIFSEENTESSKIEFIKIATSLLFGALKDIPESYIEILCRLEPFTYDHFKVRLSLERKQGEANNRQVQEYVLKLNMN